MAMELAINGESWGPVRDIRGEFSLRQPSLDYVRRSTSYTVSMETDGPHSYLPRHPEYRDKNQRLMSFTFWRYEVIQDPIKLANYGFFYTGEGDLVRCYYCSIGFKDFIVTDDPLLEHIRYSGDCPFLVEYLGLRRLAELKVKAQPVVPPQITRQLVPEQHRLACNLPKNSEPVVVTSTSRPPKKYRHPQYESMNVRLASFTNWPIAHLQTPQNVAQAGFFYTGLRDIVRCFACDGGLQQWDPTDDPWIEHCRHFPFCPYARDVKGVVYIDQVKRFYQSQLDKETACGKEKKLDSYAHSEDEVLRPMNKLTVEENLVKIHEEETHKRPSMPRDKPRWKSPVAETVLEMGFKGSEVEAAVKQIQSEDKEVTVDMILDMIENREKKRDDSVQNSLNAQDVIAEHLRLKSVLFCNRCNTKETNALFLPCQHHRFCMDCSKQMKNCAYCGKKIDHVVKTYSS